jgi:RNA polymerase sigma-70 factor (ECF subfamily)
MGEDCHLRKAGESAPEPSEREQEFLQYFACAQRGLHAYIVALVYDTNVSADLLQETNIVLWQRFDTFQSGTNFFAWAREIARRIVLRYRQTQAKRIATLDPHLLEQLAHRVSELVDASDSKRALAGCLQKLRDRDREIIAAKYEVGAKICVIADKLGRSENSISQSLRRIRQVLAECIQRTLNAEEHLSQK